VGLLLRQVYPGGRNLEKLARDLAHVFGTDVPRFASAAGDVATEPSAVAVSHRQAFTLLQKRFFSRPGTVAWPSSPTTTGPPADLESLAERLALALEAGHSGSVHTALVAAGAALAGSGVEETVKEGFSRIVSGAIERYLGHEARSSTLRARTTAWIADLWRQPFLTTLIEFLRTHLEALQAKERGPDTAGLAQKMIDLIEARYAENLKLEALAEVFHYNSAYLGKLFRSKTGEYFNTYLDQVRVRHAQDLLKEGLKVYQVAEMVGYKYVDYFHTKFKKYTGVSPSQFKGGE
jgi:two-component system response regulator YesN